MLDIVPFRPTHLAFVALFAGCKGSAGTLAVSCALSMDGAVGVAVTVLATKSRGEVEVAGEAFVAGASHREGEALADTGSHVAALRLRATRTATALRATLRFKTTRQRLHWVATPPKPGFVIFHTHEIRCLLGICTAIANGAGHWISTLFTKKQIHLPSKKST